MGFSIRMSPMMEADRGFQIESSVYLARDCGLDNSLVTMRRREYVGRRGKEVRVSRYKSTADER